MSKTTAAHVALATVIGLPAGALIGALFPAIAVAILAVNVALIIGWHRKEQHA
ncbi:MAG: hypothetical protein ABWZ77_05170 [Naasia sp.]